MAKKRHIITADQIYKMERKVRRDEEIIQNGNGWKSVRNVKPSKKTYNRKSKHK